MQGVVTQLLKSIRDAEAAKEAPKKRHENRRRPFHQIQPAMANEVAKKARERQGGHAAGAADASENSAGGVLDKIEQMLAEGKYRPDGGQRTGYRLRKKGQPTVYVSVFIIF